MGEMFCGNVKQTLLPEMAAVSQMGQRAARRRVAKTAVLSSAVYDSGILQSFPIMMRISKSPSGSELLRTLSGGTPINCTR